MEDLRSTDERVNGAAWRQAYPLLWEAAMSLLQGVLLTGASHAQDREDIAARSIQQTVRGLIEGKPESFDQIASFDDVKGMTLRIVRTRVTDFFRHRSRHPEDLTDELPEPAAENPSAAEPGFGTLTRPEFDALLLELPPPQPEIFHAHYVLGQTAAEIGEERGLPRNTVLSHLHRGKKALHQRLTALFATTGGSEPTRGPARPSGLDLPTPLPPPASSSRP